MFKWIKILKHTKKGVLWYMKMRLNSNPIVYKSGLVEILCSSFTHKLDTLDTLDTAMFTQQQYSGHITDHLYTGPKCPVLVLLRENMWISDGLHCVNPLRDISINHSFSNRACLNAAGNSPNAFLYNLSSSMTSVAV